jgi:protein phosphatase
MSCDSLFRWTSAARSDVGLVRSRNEDAYLEQPARGLWAVADGMGGHAFGDVASRMLVEVLDTIPPPDNREQLVGAARARLQAVNLQLRAEAVARGVAVMGSTVVVLLACGAEVSCLWAGDSRLYRYRHGRLQQLTRDHSQAEELRAMGPSGADAPAPSGANLITRAVGAADTLELDELRAEVRDGDLFLLCSDGLSNAADEQEMAAALVDGDCRQAAERLVAIALANGGRDNITVLVVRADDLCADKTMLNPAL